MPDYDNLLSLAGRSLRPNAIRNLTKLLGRREVISLAAGAPSSETFPLEELADLAARVIRERGAFALQYGPTKGQSALVEAVVEILRARRIESADASEIVMTTGSQQGLDLISRVIIDPGDIAFVELPSYIGGIIALHNAQAELVGVRQDQAGLDLDDLRDKVARALRAGRRPKCIYTIPNFQNPSGVSLAPERRQALVEIADRHDLLIIEDDPYFDIRFAPGEQQCGPLAALNPECVVYVSGFSKVLAPGLRCAYLRAPEPLAARVELAKEGADLSSSVLDQALVVEALRSGLIEKRLPEIVRFYEVRCNAMLEALEQHAPAGSRWTRPSGGFFVLMEAAEDVDTTEMLPAAIEAGVAYVPGQPFFVDDGGVNTMRLAFSKESPDRISQGITRLCDILKGADQRL